MPGKSAIGSVTIWGAITVVLVQVAQLAGYTLSSDDQTALINLMQSSATVIGSVISIVGAAAAIWGRVRASAKITSVLPTPAPEAQR